MFLFFFNKYCIMKILSYTYTRNQIQIHQQKWVLYPGWHSKQLSSASPTGSIDVIQVPRRQVHATWMALSQGWWPLVIQLGSAWSWSKETFFAVGMCLYIYIQKVCSIDISVYIVYVNIYIYIHTDTYSSMLVKYKSGSWGYKLYITYLGSKVKVQSTNWSSKYIFMLPPGCGLKPWLTRIPWGVRSRCIAMHLRVWARRFWMAM